MLFPNPASGSTVAAPSGGGAPTVPAAFFDDGAPGLWREMIANSPCLDVRDYPALPHGYAAGVGSFPPHSEPNSPEAQHDPA